MKILVISPYVPNPANAGGHLRISHVLRTLLEEHSVGFMAYRQPGETIEDWDLSARFHFPPVLLEPAGEVCSRGHVGLLRREVPVPWLGAPGSIRAADQVAFWDALERLPLSGFDVVHVESLALAPFGIAIKRRYPGISAVINLDNIESSYNLRRLGVSSRDLHFLSPRWFAPWRLKHAMNVLRGFAAERALLPQFDLVMTCSEKDRDRILVRSHGCHVRVIPNGVDCAYYSDIDGNGCGRTITFVGSMDSEPNQEAVTYFVRNVLPLVRREQPDVVFQVVGRDPPPALAQFAEKEGVRMTGTVHDTRPYLANTTVSVVPILSGTGTRLKILEAMAAGRPVVSTTVGAEGLDVLDGENILICDKHDKFARACVGLLRDPKWRSRLGEAGRQFVRSRHDWSYVRRAVKESYGQFSPARTTDRRMVHVSSDSGNGADGGLP